MATNKDLTLQYPSSTAYDSCMVSSFLKNIFAKCREQKTTPDLSVKTDIAEVKKDLEQLNRGGSPDMSYDYLQSMQQSLSDVGFRYAVIYKNKVPVLFTYFQLYTLSKKSFNLDEDKSFAKGILGFFLNLKKVKVVVAGNALRTETPGYCYDAATVSREEAVAAIAAIAEQIASDECATAVILKDLGAIAAAERRMLGKMGFSIPWQDQVMDMTIDPAWRSLEDYISCLGRKYKTRANKILASGEAITPKLLSYEEVLQQQPAIKRLFTDLVEKQSFTLTAGGVNNIAELKRIYGDRFEVSGYFYEDKLIAFSSAFVNEDNYELYYVGFDYVLNNEYQIYFNILFSGLERAIKLHKKQLKLGRTSFDAKASLGAQARDTDYLIKIVNIPDMAIKWFARYFSAIEDAKWKLRNPLKTSPATS